MSASGRRVDSVNTNIDRYGCSEDFGAEQNVERDLSQDENCDVAPDRKSISAIKRPLNWFNINGCEQWDKTSNPPTELGGTNIPWNAKPSTRDNEIKKSPIRPKTFNPVIGGCAKVTKEARCQSHLERIRSEIVIFQTVSEQIYELYKKGTNPDHVRNEVKNLLAKNGEISAYIRNIIPQIRLTEGEINDQDYKSFMNYLRVLSNYECLLLTIQNSNGDGPYPKNGEYKLWGKDGWNGIRNGTFAKKNEEKNDAQDQKSISQKLPDQLGNLSHVQSAVLPTDNKPMSLRSPRSLKPQCDDGPTNSELTAELGPNSFLMDIVSSNCITLQEHQVEIFSLRRMIQDILLTMCKVNLNTVPNSEGHCNDRSAPLVTFEDTHATVNDSIIDSVFLNSHNCEPTLNNQVLPGTRSNNYVDNFGSCALQNDFDTTETLGMNENAVFGTNTTPPVAVNQKPADLSSSDVSLFQNIHNEDDSFRTRSRIVTPNFQKELNIITTDTVAAVTDPELCLENDNVTTAAVENGFPDFEDLGHEIDGFEFIVNPVVNKNLLLISTNDQQLLKKSKVRIISQMVSTFITTNKENDDFLIRLFSELKMLSSTNKSRIELIETLQDLRNKKDRDILTTSNNTENEPDDESDEVSSIELSYDDGINNSYNSTGDFTI